MKFNSVVDKEFSGLVALLSPCLVFVCVLLCECVAGVLKGESRCLNYAFRFYGGRKFCFQV